MVKVRSNCRQSTPALPAIPLLAVATLLDPAPSLRAADAAPYPSDKSRFTLLDPTPRPRLRDLSTDRPDITESPFTVDAGHFQAELSFLEYTHGDGGQDQYAVLPMNLKLGLLNQVDLQLVVNPYIRTESDDETVDGFGDLQLRSKVNLWGNDEGTTSLAVMPFVQFPTAADGVGSDRVEGGLILPFAMELPGEWSLGLMAELDVVRDERNEDYGIDFVHTVAVGRGIVGPLGGYLEYIGVAPHQTGGGYQAAIGLGLTYGWSADVQLDAGVNLGLSDSADDVVLFTGISFRL